MPLQPPPFRTPIFDPSTGKMAEDWQRYFLALAQQIQLTSAPNNARYVVTRHNADLTQEINLGALTDGYLHQTVAAGIATLASSYAVLAQSSPANPTGTASTVGVMMGVGLSITPRVTGRLWITVTGTIFNPTAIADGAKAQIRVGTGASPANGDALTGSTVGSLVRYVAATVAERAPFSLTGSISGLALATAVWIDLGLAAITGGTATVADLTISAVEV